MGNSLKEKLNKPKATRAIDLQPISDSQVAVFVHKSKKRYVFGRAEYNFLVSLDGKHSLEDLAKKFPEYSKEDVHDLLLLFDKIHLLDDGDSAGRSYRCVREGWIKLKIGLASGNILPDSNSRILQFLSFLITFVSPLLFVWGIIHLYRIFQFNPSLAPQGLPPVSFWIYLVLSLVQTVFHEFAHAIVGKSFGIFIPEIGFMFYLFVPLFYADLTFTRLLTSRPKRICCLLAGVNANFFLAAVPILFCTGTTPTGIFNLCLANSFVNFITVITNLVVFFKLDGYYILQDLLEIPSFYERSMITVSEPFQSFLSRRATKGRLWAGRKQKGVAVEHLSLMSENRLLFRLYGSLYGLYIVVLIGTCIALVIERLL
jgi:putative peptide zinc metalloprotease protein